MANPDKQVFKQASKTFYYSSRFFPKRLRRDVSRLYSFVRVADDYVDEQPHQPEKLLELEKQYQAALKVEHFDPTTHTRDDADTRVIKNIVRLTQRYKFDPAWVQSFFAAMKADIKPKVYHGLDQALEYVHGSAEVIGLMMAKVMKLPEESWEYAKLQGRAMQWLNFIRDIKEDSEMNRQYFPEEELKKFGLTDLKEETARANPEGFKKFMEVQLKRYHDWQAEADKGQEYMPKRYRLPIQTAVEMFNWTAEVIEKNPFIVYKKKVKPVSRRVLLRGLSKKSKALAAETATQTKRASIFLAKKSRKLAKQAIKKAKQSQQG
jgi:phytoene synthase